MIKSKKSSLIKKTRRGIGSLLRFIVILELGFIIMYPILYMVSMAFRPTEQLYDPNIVWIPTSLTMENIKQVWEFMEYPKAFFVTVYIDLICAVIQTLVCCFVGYGFSRFKFKGKSLLFTIVIFTIIVPPSTTLISSYLQYRNFDLFGIISLIKQLFTGTDGGVRLIDTPFIMWLPALFGMGIRSGLFIFLCRQFFNSLPGEFEEAAYIDGCEPVGTFFRVILPNSKTITTTVFLFSLVWYYNDTFYSSVYLDSTRTISTSLIWMSENLRSLNMDVVFDNYQRVTLIQSGCLLTILPLLIFYIIMQRSFKESIALTGLVG